MKTRLHIILAAATVALPMLTRAQPTNQCEAIAVRPAETTLYVADGPWAAGLKALQRGQVAEGTKLLARRWKKVSKNLAQSFATRKCNLGVIRKTLNNLVLVTPATTIAGDDRFLPPHPVTMAAARALCDARKYQEALSWLMPAAIGGDREAAKAAAVVFVLDDRIEMANIMNILADSGDK